MNTWDSVLGVMDKELREMWKRCLAGSWQGTLQPRMKLHLSIGLSTMRRTEGGPGLWVYKGPTKRHGVGRHL